MDNIDKIRKTNVLINWLGFPRVILQEDEHNTNYFVLINYFVVSSHQQWMRSYSSRGHEED